MQLARRVKLRLGFVPEQVNIPLLMCFEKRLFEQHDIDASYSLIPEGTGRMIDLIENDELDVAFTVTDATLVAKANGRRLHVIGTYVESPLVWMAATAKHRPFNTWSELRESAGSRAVRVGISRKGSGSHTMATYASSLHNLGDLEFHVANNFAGLRTGVSDGSFDVFLWETFTTQPWVHSGELKSIGEVPTPWSAFSVIASDRVVTDSSTAGCIQSQLFPCIQRAVTAFTAESNLPDTVHRIVTDYKHTSEDALQWWRTCRYSSGLEVDEKVTEQSIDTLKAVGLVPIDFAVQSLWSNSVVRLR